MDQFKPGARAHVIKGPYQMCVGTVVNEINFDPSSVRLRLDWPVTTTEGGKAFFLSFRKTDLKEFGPNETISQVEVDKIIEDFVANGPGVNSSSITLTPGSQNDLQSLNQNGPKQLTQEEVDKLLNSFQGLDEELETAPSGTPIQNSAPRGFKELDHCKINGLCPKCGEKGYFSHCALVCSTHGEY